MWYLTKYNSNKHNSGGGGGGPPPKPSQGSWSLQPHKTIGNAALTPDEISKSISASSPDNCTALCKASSSDYAYYNSSKTVAANNCVCRKVSSDKSIVESCTRAMDASPDGWTLLASPKTPECPDASHLLKTPNVTRGVRDWGNLYEVPNVTEEMCQIEVSGQSDSTTNYGVYDVANKNCIIKTGAPVTKTSRDYKAGCWQSAQGYNLYTRMDGTNPWSPGTVNQCPNTYDCELPVDKDGNIGIPPSSLLSAHFISGPADALSCAQTCSGNSNTVPVPMYEDNDDGKSITSSTCVVAAKQAASLWLPHGDAGKQCWCYDWYVHNDDSGAAVPFYNTANEENGDYGLWTKYDKFPEANPSLDKLKRANAAFQVDKVMAPQGCANKGEADNKVPRSTNPTEVGSCYCLKSKDFIGCMKGGPGNRIDNCKNGATPFVLNNPSRTTDPHGTESIANCECMFPNPDSAPTDPYTKRYARQLQARRAPYTWNNGMTDEPELSGGSVSGAFSGWTGDPSTGALGGLARSVTTYPMFSGQQLEPFSSADGYNVMVYRDAQYGQPCVRTSDIDEGGNCMKGLKCINSSGKGLHDYTYNQCSVCG